eukprot:scaffold237122_cov34-Attheya_sp.AAC.3
MSKLLYNQGHGPSTTPDPPLLPVLGVVVGFVTGFEGSLHIDERIVPHCLVQEEEEENIERHGGSSETEIPWYLIALPDPQPLTKRKHIEEKGCQKGNVIFMMQCIVLNGTWKCKVLWNHDAVFWKA